MEFWILEISLKRTEFRLSEIVPEWGNQMQGSSLKRTDFRLSELFAMGSISDVFWREKVKIPLILITGNTKKK